MLPIARLIELQREPAVHTSHIDDYSVVLQDYVAPREARLPFSAYRSSWWIWRNRFSRAYSNSRRRSYSIRPRISARVLGVYTAASDGERLGDPRGHEGAERDECPISGGSSRFWNWIASLRKRNGRRSSIVARCCGM